MAAKSAKEVEGTNPAVITDEDFATEAPALGGHNGEVGGFEDKLAQQAHDEVRKAQEELIGIPGATTVPPEKAALFSGRADGGILEVGEPNVDTEDHLARALAQESGGNLDSALGQKYASLGERRSDGTYSLPDGSGTFTVEKSEPQDLTVIDLIISDFAKLSEVKVLAGNANRELRAGIARDIIVKLIEVGHYS